MNGHELAYMAWEQSTWDTYRLADLDRDDAVVVDAGANIGLFSVLAASRSATSRVLAIEPMPALVSLVERTIDLHGCGDRVAVRRLALGSQPETARFTFAPFFAALSSRHEAERADICRRLVLAIRFLLPRLARSSGLDLERAKEWINESLRETEVEVPVVRLPDLLREEAIDRVDLLKVDVEGSELAVLDGIDAETWARIDRLAIEVNDIDGRIDVVERRLREHAYDVVVEDDPSASRVVPRRIAIVHASRRPLGPRAADDAPRSLETETSMAREAAVLAAAVHGVLRDAGVDAVIRVCEDVTASPSDERADATFLEGLSGHLAELLGVPALSVADGWRHGGAIGRS